MGTLGKMKSGFLGHRPLVDVWRSFACCRRGNIAIISALALVPLVAIVGGSVDLIRMTAVSSKMRAALEAGALAGASMLRDDDKIAKAKLDAAVKDYVRSNLPSGAPWNEIRLTVKRPAGGTEVIVDGSVGLNNFFLGVINMTTSTISETAAADVGGVGALEVSLVLDISSSMAYGNRIGALRPATTNLINEIFARYGSTSTSVNLIPFGGSVNVGSTLFTKYAVDDGDADALDPGPELYRTDANGNTVNNQKFKFSDQTNGTGGNCIEIADNEFLDGKLAENQAGALPYFYLFENNPYCPSDKTAAIFNESDKKTLLDRIDEMELSDGTGMEIGMFWALKAMSPSMKGELGGDYKDRPSAWGVSSKFLIMMGDGNISWQHRPVDYTDSYINWSGKGTPEETNHQVLYEYDAAKYYYLSMCDILKTHGVTIFTVGYDVTSGAKSLLQSCASSSDHYLDATSTNIDVKFQEILDKFGGTELRISK
jgi:Flp pilus assembly protein TadG